MRLSLKTKFTLATSLLVLAVVTVVSGLYLGRLTRAGAAPGGRSRAASWRSRFFCACRNALADAAERGESPVSADPAGAARVRPDARSIAAAR